MPPHCGTLSTIGFCLSEQRPRIYHSPMLKNWTGFGKHCAGESLKRLPAWLGFSNLSRLLLDMQVFYDPEADTLTIVLAETSVG